MSDVCIECGDTIKNAIPRECGNIICAACYEPLERRVGNQADEHWDDDLSGASGSWDNAVRLCEGE